MISKEQFLELKHLKSLGMPTTTIAKKIGISVPNANKWLRMDEDAFENYLINNTPYSRRMQEVLCIMDTINGRQGSFRKHYFNKSICPCQTLSMFA